MKKKFILFLAVVLLSISIPFNVLAADKTNTEVLIVGDETPVAEYTYTNINTDNFKKTDLQDLLNFNVIAIDSKNLFKIDESILKSLLDNGSTIFVYGKSLPMEEIQSYLGTIEIKNEDLPIADPEASGYPKDSKEPLSDGLKDDVILLYAYMLNGDINFGCAIDCSNEKLKNEKTGEWVKSKDIDVYDQKGNVIKKGRALEINDVLKDINVYTDVIKEKGKKLIDIQSEENEGKVNTMMYPISSGTKIKGDVWFNYVQGKMIATVYVTEVIHGSTCYWDLATSMHIVPYSPYIAWVFKTKTYVNYPNQNVIDYESLQSDNSSLTVTLSGPPSVSYTTSTAGYWASTSVPTKAVEWQGQVIVPALNIGIQHSMEPALRSSNTSGAFCFRRYVGCTFWDMITAYSTPYNYNSYNMGIK